VKKKKQNSIEANQTSVDYRGVSSNGGKFQARSFYNHHVYYLGQYSSIEAAALAYDVWQI
jgi:hypothetical protein